MLCFVMVELFFYPDQGSLVRLNLEKTFQLFVHMRRSNIPEIFSGIGNLIWLAHLPMSIGRTLCIVSWCAPGDFGNGTKCRYCNGFWLERLLAVSLVGSIGYKYG